MLHDGELITMEKNQNGQLISSITLLQAKCRVNYEHKLIAYLNLPDINSRQYHDQQLLLQIGY